MYGINERALEVIDARPAFLPVDLAAQRNVGQWIEARYFQGVLTLWIKSSGTGPEPATLSMQQARSQSGTDAKRLRFNQVWLKSEELLFHATPWTVVEVNSDSYTNDDWGASEVVAGIWVLSRSLDPGFGWMRFIVDDTGIGSHYGMAVYLGVSPRYTGDGLSML